MSIEQQVNDAKASINEIVGNLEAVRGPEYAAAVRATVKANTLINMVRGLSHHLGQHCAEFDPKEFDAMLLDMVGDINVVVLKLVPNAKPEEIVEDARRLFERTIVRVQT